MAFQKASSSSSGDVDGFMIGLINNPRKIKIVEVSELKDNKESKNNQKYFYIHVEDIESSETVKLSFNVKVNDNDSSIYVGEGAKLYPLLSFVSHIDDGAIICFKEDIDEALIDCVLTVKAVRRKFGNRNYFVLVPISEGDE